MNSADRKLMDLNGAFAWLCSAIQMTLIMELLIAIQEGN
jgi:hypothetical protein